MSPHILPILLLLFGVAVPDSIFTASFKIENSMEKPVEPNKEDCCNSGCNPCIFDIYEKQLKVYEQYLQNGKDINLSKDNGISELEYTKFIVIVNLSICNLHNLIIFRRKVQDGKRVWWNPGHHFLYKYVSSTKSCTRPYTPITDSSVTEYSGEFSIIVKRYEKGTVSSHLCNLNTGSITLWRGPYGHYEITPNKFSRLIMIAQGTGIAPFITIINDILKNEDDMTKIVLFYCCKSLDTVLFRDELYANKSYWNFDYKIYLGLPINTGIKYQEPIKSSKLKPDELINLKPISSSDQFLICGSQEFNKNYDNHIRKEFPLVEDIVLF